MSKSPLKGRSYRIAFQLYSDDGTRSVDVMEFEGGEVFLDEKEKGAAGGFENRHSGNLVGPFASAEAAESFIVATSWFSGRQT